MGNTVQPTQTVLSSLPLPAQAEVRLSSRGDRSFYYYAGGVRTPLSLSLKWIVVKFASSDPAKRSAALQEQGSRVGSLEQAKQIPVPELSLLPLREGLTPETLLQQVNALRADRSNFLLVNPVFQAEGVEMIITDEFIATFAPEKTKEEIDKINTSHGVEIVEPIPGQANTFILRVTEKAELDSLSMANLYQESGEALDAAPNFVRVLQN